MATYNATGTAEITVVIKASSQEEANQKLADGEWDEWNVDSYDLGTEADFMGVDSDDICEYCQCPLSDDEYLDNGMCYDCVENIEEEETEEDIEEIG